METWWEQAQAWLTTPAARYAGVAAGVAAVMLVVVAVLRRLLRRPTAPIDPDAELRINLNSFGNSGPPEGSRQLECYNVPVRLALVVLAPLGRDAELPPEAEQLALLEAISPGLRKIAKRHDAVILRWPPQLSSQGFVHRFFACVPLPGAQGKGTRWCSLAGRCETESLSFAAAVALCAGQSNQLGAMEIDRPTGWLDVLRVRREA